ncbi:MAG TPA: competence/damage-inducible protein A [Nitrospiraceae bacterium]|nr:competence/damage-inducible protein A [Nitrospiraceae bacterium]
MKRGEIIAVGSELLIGGRLDTNSVFLSERLGALGIEVRFKSVVGDSEDDIVAVLTTATRRADIVILTGGLGPTSDDCTRQAVARAVNHPLRRRAEALAGMSARLAGWGRTPTVAQLKQTLIPSGADVLANPVGSAPGFSLQWNGSFIAVLPGVPREAEAMFDEAVVPQLVGNGTRDETRIERRLLHTFGLFESDIDRRLSDLMKRHRSIQLGLLASPLGVTISLMTSVTPTRTALLDRLVQAVKRRLHRHLYAEGSETMEEVVGRQLAKQGMTLAVAESCTGGLIGHRLTQVPGSSGYFDRGAITYSNQAKHDVLGVPLALLRRYGAVSSHVAAAMAKGVRLKSCTDIGLSVTGIAGPGGGTANKPVGLVYIGLNVKAPRRSSQQSLTAEFRFHGDRHTIKMRASQAALNMVRLWLADMAIDARP